MWIYANNAVTSNIYDMKVPRTLYTKMESIIFSATPTDSTKKEINSLKVDLHEIDRFQKNEQEVTITIHLANYFEKNQYLNPLEISTLKRVQQQFNEGATWLSTCSSVRNGVAAIFAFIIPMIAFRTSRKKTHMICLLIGGLGLASLNIITDPRMIAISMGLVGIAWASILSMPYAILSGSLPSHRMGYFMGVFNFFIVIPQICAATILGYITINLFHGNTMYTMVLGGLFMMLAGLLCLRVEDKD
jgi:maltose/moltooligosaccharide transporter